MPSPWLVYVYVLHSELGCSVSSSCTSYPYFCLKSALTSASCASSVEALGNGSMVPLVTSQVMPSSSRVYMLGSSQDCSWSSPSSTSYPCFCLKSALTSASCASNAEISGGDSMVPLVTSQVMPPSSRVCVFGSSQVLSSSSSSSTSHPYFCLKSALTSTSRVSSAAISGGDSMVPLVTSQAMPSSQGRSASSS